MYLIGLTGGIASGKSVVAKRLADLGAVIVDADVLARQVVEPGTRGLARIEAEFGPSVISDDGTLDRPALGAVVFADADKRALLNDITHPEIAILRRKLIDDALAANPDSMIVNDVPLLVETASHLKETYDTIIVVQADTPDRLARLVEHRGMDASEAARRIESQATDAERIAIADVVIDNNGSLEETLEQVDRVWAEMSESARSKHRG